VTLGKAVAEALDRAKGPTTVVAGEGGASAEVDVVDGDRLGIRLKSLRVHPAGPIDVGGAAATLPGRLKTLPGERLEPIEVEPARGRAVLRSPPDEEREWFDLDIDRQRGLDLTRKKTCEGGGREDIDWTMTRGQLEKLVDELG
jgi:hypothetical protein